MLPFRVPSQCHKAVYWILKPVYFTIFMLMANASFLHAQAIHKISGEPFTNEPIVFYYNGPGTVSSWSVSGNHTKSVSGDTVSVEWHASGEVSVTAVITNCDARDVNCVDPASVNFLVYDAVEQSSFDQVDGGKPISVAPETGIGEASTENTIMSSQCAMPSASYGPEGNLSSGCSGNYILTATSTPPTGTTYSSVSHRWFLTSTSTSPFTTTTATQPSSGGYTAPGWSSSTSYFVSSTRSFWVSTVCSSGGESARREVIVVVNNPQTLSIDITNTSNQPVVPYDLCAGTSVKLTGKGGSGYSWYLNGTLSNHYIGGGTSITVSQSGTYYLKGIGACGQETRSEVLTFKPALGAASFSQPGDICRGTTTTTYTATASNASAFTWSLTNAGSSTVTWTTSNLNATNSSTTATVTWNSSFTGTPTLSVTAHGCASTTSTLSRTFTVKPVPVSSIIANGTVIYQGKNVELKSSSIVSGYSYQWLLNDVAVATGSTHMASKAGSYRLRITHNGCVSTSSPVVLTSKDFNYITTTAIMVPGITNVNAIGAFDKTKHQESTVYYDGLGRPMQNVVREGSWNSNDIVQPVIYDQLGRESKKFLPFTANNVRDGFYKENIINANQDAYTGIAASFYATGTNNKITGDTRPYAETVFEPSPLNRPQKEFGPGQSWKQGDKAIVHAYLTNEHGTDAGQERIIAWTINASGMPIRHKIAALNSSTGYYGSNALFIKSTRDEHGKEVREYSNKQGQVILKKVQLSDGAPSLDNRSHWMQTYYIYDDFGNLRYVLQPELVFKVMVDNNYNPSADDLNLLAFQYKYDARRRMVEKKVPGADWVYMVYDNRDRLVLTQDGNQRNKTNREWSFTKYDQLNRPIMAGIHDTTSLLTQAQMQGVVNTHINKNTDRRYSEVLVGTASGNIHNYSNRGYPKVKSANSCLSVTYYDNYGFLSYTGWDAENRSYVFVAEIGVTQGMKFDLVTGLATGSKVKAMDGSNLWLNSVSYYDDKYRLIQSIHENNVGGTDRFTTQYNFSDWVKQTHLTHTGPKTIRVLRKYGHDHAGRVTSITHNVDQKGDVLLASFDYNELGELVDKKLHVSGSTGLQSIDYRYNIRGWLTHINNSKLTSDNGLTNDDTNDFFGMELIYNGTMGDFPMTAYNPFQNPYPFDFHNPSSVMLASNESQHPANAWASVNHPSKSTTEDLIREANERIESYMKGEKSQAQAKESFSNDELSIIETFPVLGFEKNQEEEDFAAEAASFVSVNNASSTIIVPNGTFDTNISGWRANGANQMSWVAPGKLRFEHITGNRLIPDIDWAPYVGRQVRVRASVEVIHNPGSGNCRIQYYDGAWKTNGLTSTTANFEMTFTVGNVPDPIYFRTDVVGTISLWDDIIIEVVGETPPVPTNILPNGTFDTNISGWRSNGSNQMSWVAPGKLRFEHITGNRLIPDIDWTPYVGRQVRVRASVEVIHNPGSGNCRIQYYDGAWKTFGLTSTTANFEMTFTVGNVPDPIYFRTDVVGTISLWDDIIIEVVGENPTAPAAPTNFTATAASTSAINLSWSIVANATSYVMESSSTSSSAGFSTLATLQANATSYSHTGLQANTDYFYRLRAVNSAGSSANATGTAKTLTASGSTVTLLPTADAFTRGGSYANDNYGTATNLNVKTSTHVSFHRHAYLKFDLSSVSSVNNAKLRLYAYSYQEDTGTINLAVYGSNTDTWTETGINWNNAPAVNTDALSTIPVGPAFQYYEFDVTSFVQSQFSGDKVVTLVVRDPAMIDRYVDFYSRENATFKPELVISQSSGGTAPAAPTNLLVSTGGTNSLKLEWKDNATNETGYVVERLNGSNWQVVANLPANATSYTLTGLPAGATLQVRVKAVNGATGSAYAQASGTTSGHVPGAFAFVPQFNGNIAGVKWANNGGSSQKSEKAYVYSYDAANRLRTSSYAVRNPVGGQFDRGGFNENLTYDHNGNILSLKRSGLAPVATFIDDLDMKKEFYRGNQLMRVEDLSTNHAGFKNGNAGSDDYVYDKNGNMTVDKNKGITNIKYNHLNLPEEVTMEGGRKIEYIYDAAGTKLGQRVTEPGKPAKETWYVGEIIYENELNQPKELVLIQHEEGRIVPDAVTAGAYEYQYHIKDHLGNVRVTFTSKPKTHTYTVNYENSQARPDDIALFAETGNIITNNLFDKTDAGTTYTKSQRLTGANGARIGSVIAIPVGAGDKVSAEVYAKYVAATNTNNPGGSIAPLLLAALTGTPGANIVDGSSSAITTGYGNSSLITNAAYNYSYDATAPMAFINLLFIPERAQSSIDKAHFAFKQINKGAQQIGTTTSAAHDLMQINNFEAKENGYVIIYLSNESAKLTEVYFDELKITLNENRIIQTDDYYPFGMAFNSFKRSTNTENRFLYNGKELQKEANWYDYHARQYDPALCRWLVIDPEAQQYYSHSSYNYVLNNPIKNIDPDGKIVGTVVGTIVGGVAGAIDAYVNNKDYASSIAEGATAGFVAGAVVDLTVATGGGAAVVFGAAIAGGALGGAAGDIVGQTTNNVLVNNQSLSEAFGHVDRSQVGNKALAGAVSGVVGGALGAGTGKIMQGAANSAKASMKAVGESIESTAKEIMQQGTTNTTTNGVTTYSQTSGLTGKVQGVMDNMVKGMGQSGRAAANGIVATNTVATGVTEAATKTAPTQSTADYLKKTISSWFD